MIMRLTVFFLLVSCILLLVSCSGKKEDNILRMKTIEGINVIKPDIKSLVLLFEMQVKDWKVLVEEKGFQEMGDESMLFYTKTNTTKEMVIQGLNKSSEEFGISWTNFDSGELLMGEIEVELKDFFVEESGLMKYYLYTENEKSYLISLSRNKSKGVEVLSIEKAESSDK